MKLFGMAGKAITMVAVARDASALDASMASATKAFSAAHPGLVDGAEAAYHGTASGVPAGARDARTAAAAAKAAKQLAMPGLVAGQRLRIDEASELFGLGAPKGHALVTRADASGFAIDVDAGMLGRSARLSIDMHAIDAGHTLVHLDGLPGAGRTLVATIDDAEGGRVSLTPLGADRPLTFAKAADGAWELGVGLGSRTANLRLVPEA